MVQLQDWKVEAPAVLCHRKVNPVFLYLLPLQGKHLGFAKTSKQEKLIEYAVDRVGKIIDCLPPLF